MKYFVNLFLFSLAGLAYAALDNTTYSEITNPLLRAGLACLTAALVASTAQVVLEYLPIRVKYYRSIFTRYGFYEGYWLQEVEKEDGNYYCFLTVSLLPETKELHMQAVVFDEGYNHYCDWSSNHVRIVHKSKTLYYHYTSTMKGGKSIKGCGEYFLKKIPYTNSASGDGNFSDAGHNVSGVFTITRIRKKTLREAVGKGKKLSKVQYREMAKKYIEHYKRSAG